MGVALINSIANIGGMLGPFMIGELPPFVLLSSVPLTAQKPCVSHLGGQRKSLPLTGASMTSKLILKHDSALIGGLTSPFSNSHSAQKRILKRLAAT